MLNVVTMRMVLWWVRDGPGSLMHITVSNARTAIPGYEGVAQLHAEKDGSINLGGVAFSGAS